jgi:hypothetical protein
MKKRVKCGCHLTAAACLGLQMFLARKDQRNPCSRSQRIEPRLEVNRGHHHIGGYTSACHRAPNVQPTLDKVEAFSFLATLASSSGFHTMFLVVPP